MINICALSISKNHTADKCFFNHLTIIFHSVGASGKCSHDNWVRLFSRCTLNFCSKRHRKRCLSKKYWKQNVEEVKIWCAILVYRCINGDKHENDSVNWIDEEEEHLNVFLYNPFLHVLHKHLKKDPKHPTLRSKPVMEKSLKVGEIYSKPNIRSMVAIHIKHCNLIILSHPEQICKLHPKCRVLFQNHFNQHKMPRNIVISWQEQYAVT